MPEPGNQADSETTNTSHDHTNPDFFEKNLTQHSEINAPGGKASHHNRRRLASNVTAHTGNNRNKHEQSDHFLEGHLEKPHQVAGRNATEQVNQQPGQTKSGDFESFITIEELFLVGTCHLVDIFSRLLPNNIDNIIYGDDTLQAVHLIDNRYRKDIIFFNNPRNLFLVHVGAHTQNIGDHDLRKFFRW